MYKDSAWSLFVSVESVFHIWLRPDSFFGNNESCLAAGYIVAESFDKVEVDHYCRQNRSKTGTVVMILSPRTDVWTLIRPLLQAEPLQDWNWSDGPKSSDRPVWTLIRLLLQAEPLQGWNCCYDPKSSDRHVWTLIRLLLQAELLQDWNCRKDPKSSDRHVWTLIRPLLQAEPLQDWNCRNDQKSSDRHFWTLIRLLL